MEKKGPKNGILGLGGFFGVAGDVFGAEALIVGDSVGELCREKNSKKKRRFGGRGVFRVLKDILGFGGNLGFFGGEF